jgi:hypothetical protein
MLTRILRKLGVKVVIFRLSHDVLNATSSIAGVLKVCRSTHTMTIKQHNEIIRQLVRIEQALRYVRRLNKGCE